MTRPINPCTYGGGTACERQGGSGEASHAAGYVHPIPTSSELGRPAGDPVEPLGKSEVEYVLPELSEFFDESFAKSVLGVSLDAVIHARDVVRKSLYDFDLDTVEGVLKLLELLPIMDREILGDIAGEIWPGYPAQDSNPDLLRLEIKGYLMDYLDGHGTQEAETAPEGLGDETGPEGSEEEPQEPAEGEAGADAEAAAAPQGPDSAEGSAEQGPPDDEPAPEPGAEA